MITLLQLDYFRKLAATEHITQTAKELYISQTALSSMIIGLEKELGVQLFDRSKRSIRLNQAGRLYLQYVNEVFAALKNGRSALQELTESAERQVSLAVGTSQVWLPMIRDFRKHYPECSIKQHNQTLDELIESLRSMKTDFVIASTDEIPDTDLEHVFLKKDSVYLCVPKTHPLAGRDKVWLRELENEPYIDLPAGTPWRVYCARLFKQAGVTIRTVLECDYSIRAALIDSEFGVALTSASAYEVDMLKPNCYVPIADEFAYREMALFWNPKKYMSQTAKSFRDFCVGYWEKDKT
ncbi:MAG: LysR family transcriptional regulator [Oscillospiraceae bacterium]|nr:LysR family transcriptional regulator [Oscillospiraceae bacterium]